MNDPLMYAGDALLPREAILPGIGAVCRLGLATRGNTSLDCEDVLLAIDRGVNYLNWCGHPDGMREAIRQLGPRRKEVRVVVQMEARTAAAADREISNVLGDLKTDYLDLVTYYYVEQVEEWDEIIVPGGAAETLLRLRREGIVRAIGATSHQRPLAARIAATGMIDVLMIRYNAAHRGAEQEVFPVTMKRGIPVVAFTCLRWGALLQSTPGDPPGFVVPPASMWYRFVLAHPAVSVALMAPDGPRELEENLALMDHWEPLTTQRYELLAEHGQRVRRHAGNFP